MDRKPLVSIDSMVASIRGQVNAFKRRSVEDAWRIGEDLIELREMVREEGGERGRWKAALDEIGLNDSLARRWMRLRRAHDELGTLYRFHSVNEAIQALLPRPEDADDDADFPDADERVAIDDAPTVAAEPESTETQDAPDDGAVTFTETTSSAEAEDADFIEQGAVKSENEPLPDGNRLTHDELVKRLPPSDKWRAKDPLPEGHPMLEQRTYFERIASNIAQDSLYVALYPNNKDRLIRECEVLIQRIRDLEGTVAMLEAKGA